MKTINQSAEVGCVVGRFQVPELHEAHKKLIQSVFDAHPRVFVILGLSAGKCSYNNPLDFQARKAMIEEAFPTAEVYYVDDRRTDELWSKDLDKQIARHLGPGQKILLYGSRDCFIPHYCGKYPTMELVSDRIISGKEIRKSVGIKSKSTVDFRRGVISAVENEYPHIVTTVDVAILDFPNNRIGLARKEDENELRFVGGHAENGTDSFEADAMKELGEEVPNLECSNLRYIGSSKIDSWRQRNERDKIKTLFFAIDYVFGSPIAADDIAEFRWVNLNELNRDMFVEEHRVLYDMLKGWMVSNDPTPKSIVDVDSV